MTGTNRGRTFRPHPWQIKPWRDKSLVLLMDGPAGSGKSHIAANKVDAYLRKYPNATGLMLRKTRESMTNSTLLFYDRMVVGNDPHVRLKRNDKRFEYANGSLLAYGGMKDQQQREAIRSIGLEGGVDIIWIEEAHLFTLDDFEELLPRLRGKAAYNYYRGEGYSHEQAKSMAWVQIILTTNPDSDQHWIYKRLILGGEASRYFSLTADNPSNPDNYESTVLGKLTGVRRLRLKDGKWVAAEGAVYEDYRYEVHVIEPFAIPAQWPRYRAIDFGFTNPFVCQWWAEDPDGRLYLYREIYMSQRTVADHADQIKQLEAGVDPGVWKDLTDKDRERAWSLGERITRSTADHDAEDRATLSKAGIHTTAAKKAISVGIQKTQERFRVQADGKPRIFLFNDALVEADPLLEAQKKPICTMDELGGYLWQKGQDGKPNKEVPVQVDDHGMDTMRYMVMLLDSPQQSSTAPAAMRGLYRPRPKKQGPRS